KRVIFCCIILIEMKAAVSQIVYQQIEQEFNAGRISEVDAVFLEALQTYIPDQLHEPYREPNNMSIKCTFGLNCRIRERWEDFSPEQQRILEPFLYRPDLPQSYVSPLGFFKIHYTLSGWDAVSPDDLDGSGVPDYVEGAAITMDHVYAVVVDQLGYNPPPDDQNRDGSEWDIYLLNTGNSYGETVPEMRISQNPDRYASYMKLDNDYSDKPTQGLQALQVTAAHEFFHMVQLGYNFRSEDRFLMEAGSTWIEDVAYDYVNDYYFYLTKFFSETNIPFQRINGWREYGLCVWFHFLVKRLEHVLEDPRVIVRSVWEEMVSYPAVEAIDIVLQGVGYTFDEELALFYGWNYMTGSRADTSRFYPEGYAYPEITLDSVFRFQQDTTLNESVESTAARYFHFYQDNGILFTLIPTNLNRESGSSSDEMTLSLIQREGDSPYTYLGDGIQTALITGNVFQWKCVAAVEFPDMERILIPFEGINPRFSENNLPPCYPNPFIARDHATTTIPFVLDESGLVKIIITQLSGYRVKEDQIYYDYDGLQSYVWDGMDIDHRQAPSGVYIYVITSGNQLIRREKIALVR
ncbi:T9SS type A sorting domain-containing protein, partial [bacterium]|nr:T9SS type A sorting domain-containing protein [bacterium]